MNDARVDKVPIIPKLVVTHQLRDLAARFSTFPIDWEHLLKLYGDYVIFSGDGKSRQDALIGTLAELHLRSFLEKEAVINKYLKLLPIPSDTKVDRYVFKYGRLGNYQLIDSYTKMDYIEYDFISTLDDIPVVWEVKACEYSKGAFSHRRINRIFQPITKYFHSPTYSYVVVMPKGRIFSEEAEQSIKDILYAPMSVDLQEFQQEISLREDCFSWQSIVQSSYQNSQ